MIEIIKEKINNIKDKIKTIKKEDIILFIKKRWLIILVIFLVVGLFIGYTIGSSTSSKSRIISSLENALKKEDVDELRDIVLLNDEKVSKKDLQPLIDYYKNDSSKVDSTISLLTQNGETADFYLSEQDGLFGKKYIVNLKVYNIKVNSNYKEGIFKCSNKPNEIIAGQSFLRLIPGVYKIKGSLKSEFGDITIKDEVILMENKEVQIDFSAINIVVDSKFTDSKIYINNKDTGYLVKDNKEIGPLSTDGSTKVYLEKEFPWGKIKSEEVTVKDIPKVTININMENEALKEETDKVVSNFYKSVFKALNEEDKDLIQNSTEEVKNKIYDILEESYIILKRNYEISSINISDENKEYIYENGQYSAIFSVDVNYEISKTFLNLSPTENEKSFSTKIIYRDGEWLIDDIENFIL